MVLWVHGFLKWVVICRCVSRWFYGKNTLHIDSSLAKQTFDSRWFWSTITGHCYEQVVGAKLSVICIISYKLVY